MDPEKDDERRSYGMRAAGALVPRIARAVYQRRSPASAQLLADWQDIVGPELALVCYPKRFSGGTLTLACHGVVAIELMHRSTLLIGRINGALGDALVARIVFVQELPRGVAPPPEPAADAPQPRRLSELPEGPLRDALELLARVVRK